MGRPSWPRPRPPGSSPGSSLSMDVLKIEEEDLDPLVDGVEGVTAFYLNAGDGHILFI